MMFDKDTEEFMAKLMGYSSLEEYRQKYQEELLAKIDAFDRGDKTVKARMLGEAGFSRDQLAIILWLIYKVAPKELGIEEPPK